MKTALLLSSVLIASNLYAQVKTRPVATPAQAVTIDKSTTTAATTTSAGNDQVASVNAMFNQMEAAIEMQFEKLKSEIKAELDPLKHKVAQIDKQITELKKQANRLEKMIGSVDVLMPQLIVRKDSIIQTPGGGLLNGELVRQQNSIDSLQQVRTGAADQLLQVNGQINLKLQEKQPFLPRISVLEEQLVLLDKQKAQLLVHLRNEREQTLEQVVKQNQQLQMTQLEMLMKQRVNTFLRDSLGTLRSRPIGIQ